VGEQHGDGRRAVPSVSRGSAAETGCQSPRKTVPALSSSPVGAALEQLSGLPANDRLLLSGQCPGLAEYLGAGACSASSRARCCGLSRSRGTGPSDRSAPAPPSRQARCHRRNDALGQPLPGRGQWWHMTWSMRRYSAASTRSSTLELRDRTWVICAATCMAGMGGTRRTRPLGGLRVSCGAPVPGVAGAA